MKHLKVLVKWNDEILIVFAQFLWTLKYVFLTELLWEIVFGIISGNHPYLQLEMLKGL